jgi:hypothetical protein
MREYWLVVVDTTQIQPYIFGSNRLAENIGASWLVKQATGEWALEATARAAPRNNIQDKSKNRLDLAKHIEGGNLDAEVIYAGGGNVLVLFADEPDKPRAQDFIRRLSRQVLCEAPGLQLLFTKQRVDWDAQPAQLFNAVRNAFADLEKQKAQRAHDAPLLGLGVTMACQSTGLPAAMMHQYASEPWRPISAEIKAKMDAAYKSHGELHEQFKQAIGSEFDFPGDFDDLGRKRDEQSFIAVVHADGNGFGQAMIEIGKRNSGDNRAYINAVRERSQAVARASLKAMSDVLNLLCRPQVIESDKDDKGKERRSIVRRVSTDHGEEVVARIVLKRERGAWWLPFRPLVYGGDDTTFVCDGRLGVSLAVEYLTQFKEHATRELKEPSSACSGIAIVKSHYPFARAYVLSEDLCKSAKRFRAQEHERTGQEQGSYLDWHFAVGGLVGELSEVRRREYRTKHGNLCLRPLNLDAEPPSKVDVLTARRWAVVERALHAFQGKDWATRRNKVKALRDALRQGEEAVKRFCLMYLADAREEDGRKLPRLSDAYEGVHRTNGWLDAAGVSKEARCAYFDAIELADVYMPLVQQSVVGAEAEAEKEAA